MTATPHPSLPELVAAIQFLHGQGWTPATSSNFSVRTSSDGFLVSESGRDKGSMTPQHFLSVDLAGQAAPGEDRRPSAETLLHAAVYAQHPEMGCVLHTHSVNATVLSLHQQQAGELTLRGFEVLKGLRGLRTHETAVRVPVFANSQDMESLGAEVASWLREEHAAGRRTWGYLIAGHGLYAWGDSVAEAKRHVEVFEFLFECTVRLAQLSASGLPRQLVGSLEGEGPTSRRVAAH